VTRPPIEVLLRGEDSGGRLALVEMAVEAGFAGPRCTYTSCGTKASTCSRAR
jgi:hypothetical protein